MSTPAEAEPLRSLLEVESQDPSERCMREDIPPPFCRPDEPECRGVLVPVKDLPVSLFQEPRRGKIHRPDMYLTGFQEGLRRRGGPRDQRSHRGWSVRGWSRVGCPGLAGGTGTNVGIRPDTRKPHPGGDILLGIEDNERYI